MTTLMYFRGRHLGCIWVVLPNIIGLITIIDFVDFKYEVYLRKMF